jgi:hypothetical protein
MNPPGRKISRLRIPAQSDQKKGRICPPQWLIALPVNRDRAYYRTFLRLELVPQCELHDSRVRQQAAESSE